MAPMNAARAAMTEAITIVVPGSPSTDLAPNRRVHGFAKAEATAQHRDDARGAALDNDAINLNHFRYGRGLFDGPVSVSLLVRWGKGHRRRDLDTVAICCKPFLDGLTDAHVWDDDAQIKRLTVEQERDESGRGEVVIRVEEMP